IRSDSFLVKKLSSATWFKSPWKSGLFLFVLNTVLFSVSLLLIIGVGYLQIPFIHLFVMAAAVLVSFYLWNIVYICWEGTSKCRLMQGFIGSVFYLILTINFIYMIVTMDPEMPEEDSFMGFIVFSMGGFVTLVAYIACFFTTGFTAKK